MGQSEKIKQERRMPVDGVQFKNNIFINCPFDTEYMQMLRALVFTIIDCDFEPRIASEREDAGEIRVSKIKKLIRESCYSIHDISRMEPIKKDDPPRFNMPFELGLDLGCRDFGNSKFHEKTCLILEREKYRYQRVISDISGNDIKSHNDEPEDLVRQVRNWIRTNTSRNLKSGTKIWRRFNEFVTDFEAICDELDYDDKERKDMPIVEYMDFVKEWIRLKN